MITVRKFKIWHSRTTLLSVDCLLPGSNSACNISQGPWRVSSTGTGKIHVRSSRCWGPSVHCSGAEYQKATDQKTAEDEACSFGHLKLSPVTRYDFPLLSATSEPLCKNYFHLLPITIVPIRALIIYILLKQLWPGISSPPLSWINAHKRQSHICPCHHYLVSARLGHPCVHTSWDFLQNSDPNPNPRTRIQMQRSKMQGFVLSWKIHMLVQVLLSQLVMSVNGSYLELLLVK